MEFYSITIEGVTWNHFKVPERLPVEGDIYEAVEEINTLGGFHPKGSKFRIIARTKQSRHDRLSSLGNLVIETSHGLSIWAEFDNALACGRFKLVE